MGFCSKKAIMKYIIIILLISGCTFIDLENQKDLYELEIKGVLTEDGLDTLSRDKNGYYHLRLNRYRNQTVRRVTGLILKNGIEPFPPEKVEWESNLYWWLLRGDTVAQITRTYFNPFTGSLQEVILPSLIAQKDELVPTINCCSYNGRGGEINTMIAPILNMVGDTLIIQAYNYTSNQRVFTKVVLE